MSKAILVIDMPDSCDSCPLFGNHYSDLCCKALNNRSIDYPYPKDVRQEWCPLRELPQKKRANTNTTAYDKAVQIGYNICIDTILKEGAK